VPALHPAEFRRRAVELARQRSKPIAELAKDLGISESCLQNWLAQVACDFTVCPIWSVLRVDLGDHRWVQTSLWRWSENNRRAAGHGLIGTCLRGG
jgi:Transposase